jgi:hypothetical protein
MKYGYKTMMQGSKSISQRDAYAGAMNRAFKNTKVFGLASKKMTKLQKTVRKRKMLSKAATKMLGQ